MIIIECSAAVEGSMSVSIVSTRSSSNKVSRYLCLEEHSLRQTTLLISTSGLEGKKY